MCFKPLCHRLYQHLKALCYQLIREIPCISDWHDRQVQKQIDQLTPGLIRDRFKNLTTLPTNSYELYERTHLPGQPYSDQQILERITQLKTSQTKPNWKVSGTSYADQDQLKDLLSAVYRETAWLNPTHSSVWPDLTQLEAETISIMANLFQTQGQPSGIITSGGTMSNIQVVYTYRQLALKSNSDFYQHHKPITKPNLVAPHSVHTSIKKACQILQIEYREFTPSQDHVATSSDYLPYIDQNTILLVASAPSFPYGLIDGINSISFLAKNRKLPLHLDCCLGGFMIPFHPDQELRNIFSFTNPAITSISCDPHKFGQSPKGISVLLFKNPEIKQHLTFVDLKWSGGLYVMPDFLGSRSGANIATLWATLHKLSRSTYQKTTKKLIALQKSITSQISHNFQHNQLQVKGTPQLSTFGLTSQTLNIHFINKVLSEQFGWEFNSLPDGIHFCLTQQHLAEQPNFEQQFLTDLTKAVNYVIDHPEEDPGERAQIYCSTQEIPDYAEDILDQIGRKFIEIQSLCHPPNNKVKIKAPPT